MWGTENAGTPLQLSESDEAILGLQTSQDHLIETGRGAGDCRIKVLEVFPNLSIQIEISHRWSNQCPKVT